MSPGRDKIGVFCNEMSLFVRTNLKTRVSAAIEVLAFMRTISSWRRVRAISALLQRYCSELSGVDKSHQSWPSGALRSIVSTSRPALLYSLLESLKFGPSDFDTVRCVRGL